MAKILTVVGARPQFVKAAVVTKALQASGSFTEILVHTGQHFDSNMSDVFFNQMGIPRPDHTLDINGGAHGSMTGRMLIALEEVLLADRPDLVLVYGDTNSTLAAALAAAKLEIPIAHVEAGLRSFDRAMPEEINRILTDHVSALLFAPTEVAVQNLSNEGITANVFMVGDVMYDSTLMMTEAAKAQPSVLEPLGLQAGQYHMSTLHRQSTTDSAENLKAAIDFLRAHADGKPVVLPVHPRTRKFIQTYNIDLSGLMVLDPVGPIEMHALLKGCISVFTDSGGVQKEAYFHRKPCITLRDTTEWVETVEAGWNRLWTQPDYRRPLRDIPDYGTGKASEIIVGTIKDYLNA